MSRLANPAMVEALRLAKNAAVAKAIAAGARELHKIPARTWASIAEEMVRSEPERWATAAKMSLRRLG